MHTNLVAPALFLNPGWIWVWVRAGWGPKPAPSQALGRGYYSDVAVIRSDHAFSLGVTDVLDEQVS